MAEYADGSVTIKVELDTSDVKAGSGNINAAMKRAASSTVAMAKDMTKALSSVSYDKGAMEFMENFEKALDGSSEAAKQVLGVFDQVGIYGGEAVKSMQAVADETERTKQAAEDIHIVDDGSAESLQQQIASVKEALKQMEAAGLGAGDAKWDEAYQMLCQLEAELKKYKAALKEAALAQSDVLPETQLTPWERFKSTLSDVAKRLLDVAGASEKATRRTKSLKSGVSSSLKTLLKYGVGIRSLYVLFNRLRRAISDGLSMLAEQDSQTKATLDGLKTSLNQVKASLATAFAPVLDAVAPLLSKLCSMLVTAANYVAMFFAVLGGKSTYKRVSTGAAGAAASISTIGTAAAGASESVQTMGTKAVSTYGAVGNAIKIATVSTDELGNKTASAASGVKAIAKEAKEAEKNLTGLDELNIWKVKEESGSGGSGGGGSGGGGGGLDVAGGGIGFEEVPIDTAFADNVKGILDEVIAAVEAVGAGLLTWKIAKSFGADLKTAAALAMDVAGGVLLIKGNMDAWVNGSSWGSLAKQLSGTALLAGGLYKQFGRTGGAIGGLVGGISMIITSLKEWIEVGKLSNAGLVTMEAGIAAVGVTLSILTGTWIPAALAAVAGLFVGIAARWDKFFPPFSEQVKKEVHQLGIDTADEATQGAYETMRKAGVSMQEAAEAIGVKVIDSGATKATASLEDWTKALNRKIGYSVSSELASSLYDSGLSVQEASIVIGSKITRGIKDGLVEEKPGIDETVESEIGGANATLDKKFRQTRNISKDNFSRTRTDVAEEVSGMASDVSDGYSDMTGTVGDESGSMHTDSDTAWTAMKALLVSMADLMNGKVVSVYDSMGKKINTIMDKADSESAAAWTSIETTARTALEGTQQATSQAAERIGAATTACVASVVAEWGHMKEDVTTNSRGMVSSVASEMGKLPDTVSGPLESLRNSVTSVFNAIKSSAYSWGSDLGALFSSGLRSKVSSIASAASAAASAARSYLHFSVPDKGPLSDADEYGGDFMELLASKMLQAQDVPAQAALTVAQRMDDAFSRVGQTYRAPALASGTVVPPRTVYTDGPVQGLGDVTERLRQLLSGTGAGRESRSVQYTFIGELDGKVLFRKVIDEAKAQQGRSGMNPFMLEG